MPCLTEDAVTEFVAGQMKAEDAAAVDRHMVDCDTCRTLVADVARISFEEDSSVVDAESRPRTPGAGDVVGRYRLIEIVGVGGMGMVYAAEDPELGRRIALKLIRADLANTSGIELTRRLHQEARAMAKISHPNVVTVYDIGTIGDHLFVAMEYVNGTTLRAWRSAAQRSWTEILDAFIAAGRGLAAAHAVGLIHRDFKPENVLCGADGRVRVTDFGLARGDLQAPGDLSGPELTARTRTQLVGSPTYTTAAGQVMGTPAYMALEPLSGSPADARSDQFSFAVALFEALYEIRPYPAKDIGELLRKLESGQISDPPPATEVPAALHAILTRGLRPKAEDRFPSMQAMLDELVKVLPRASARSSRGRSPLPPSPPASPKAGPTRRVVFVAAAVALCAIGVGAWRMTSKPKGPINSHAFPRPAGPRECPRGQGLYCANHGVDGDPARLYRCAASNIITEEKTCNLACMHLGRGAADACDGDAPDCPFTGSGVYCGYNYLSADPKKLYRCAEGKVTVAQECRTRCIEEPDRIADHCD